LNVALLAAAISGAVSIIGVVVSYLLSKRKEREADWRKLRLEHYDEYVTALSGVVVGQESSPEMKGRYATAVNSIALVAPPAVLGALYAFQDETGGGKRREQMLNELMNALRQDIHPRSRNLKDAVAVRFLGVPTRSEFALESSPDQGI
jgi:hypothetical protein